MKKTNHSIPEPGRFDRQGFPEAIYGPGKTIEQIISISKKLLTGSGPVLITRVDAGVYKKVKKKFPKAEYIKDAGMIVVSKRIKIENITRFVCVITAGTTDIPVAQEAAAVCEVLGVKVERVFDVGVSGVHRLFKHEDLIKNACCIVVCAGMEGALASVVGGLASSPVIGVPTSVGYGVSFKGVSAMLTMLNSCAPNVSVVNIDDGFGAGVIAALVAKGGQK